MTPPKVFIVDGQLYLEEGVELAKLLPIEEVARRHRTYAWTEFFIGVLLGAAVAVARFALQ